LLLACAYLLYGAAMSLIGASPVQATQLPSAEPAATAAKGDPGRYAVIGQRNLFQTLEAAVPLQPVAEKLAESKLKLRLLGTTAVEPAELSVASIEDVSTRKVEALRVGDAISGARLVRVERHRVVLDNGGKLEQISLDTDGDVRVNRVKQNRTERHKQSQKRREALAARRRTSTRTPPPKPAEPAPPRTPSPGERLREIMASPELELAAGERVGSVNGFQVSDRESLSEMLDSLAEGGPTIVTIVDMEDQEREVRVEATE
jgi:glucose/arabinose dehydrogenase